MYIVQVKACNKFPLSMGDKTPQNSSTELRFQQAIIKIHHRKDDIPWSEIEACNPVSDWGKQYWNQTPDMHS